MAQASGVYKQVAYKYADGTAGAAASGSGAQLLRRVTAAGDLSKDTYSSNEIRSDFQRSDMRHGVRRATFNLGGELSPLTYADFFAGVLKRNFTAVSALTSLSLTIASSGSAYTITRGSGSFLTAGLKVGMVIRLTAGSFTAGNLNKNLVIAALTAAVATVYVLNGSSLTAEGPIASATITVPGKLTYTPQTGHIEKFFTIEEWFPEVPASFTGYDLRVSNLAIALPATGLSTVTIDLMGKDVIDDTSQRFTSATAATTTGLTAAVNGVVLFEGATVATITSLNLTVASTYTGDPVVGSNNIPQLSPGRVIVNGTATIKFVDTVYRAAFRDETEVDLAVVLTTTNAAASDFLSLILSRVKLGGAARDDGEKEIIQTVPFEALLDTAGGSGTATEMTTLMVHDSAVS